ncbi:RNA methyltransferase [Puniceicoccales bacterium CK1056]|uniref:RNA methyltransferase n=1 Tax=Oceanipulchritudo coccoides TaxID=2706888 RepID=A0A6B2LX46_9BACT|nr:RNA methyltransferase [Oceanipulchritudo coccoides]NDV61138.1 RNA methyltransferase [Oceanipulchritudo coccoides]
MFETISSVQNPRVKNLVRLREGSHRRRQGKFLIEGYREIKRALATRWPMETLFFSEDLFKEAESFQLIEAAEDAGLEMVKLSPEAFAKSAYRQGPDGLLATGLQKETTLKELKLSKVPLLLALEALEKPGNIGAVFRTASAAGVDALILTNPVTDPYNPNVIRASQGAFFDVPFCQVENADLMVFLEEHEIRPVLTSPDGENLLWDEDLKSPSMILLGSEEKGLSPDWLETYPACRIPMKGVTDSLNVAAMAAIATFEAVRQRQTQP